ncbi:MutS-related protein [Flavobacterium kingsejongi]|uniref:DNA mismatch repair protein n=1 Tax=Flavobacterium kingsejongi TaxID=1678728 RepID=A0A2S1LP64_9FLAO|nr:DNA mismatch repair protein [Flavobacterium kingsejongi]AWG25545.1 DNA mismatch repair protein [Flavobacterium kingsejongi]
MQIYQTKKETFRNELSEINTKYNTIGFLRLLTIVGLIAGIYYTVQTGNNYYLLGSGGCFLAFIVLMRIHNKLSIRKKIKTALLEINTDEMAFLNKEKIPFGNGIEFEDLSHPYAYDLDLFGNHSLYQNINRTETYSGSSKLAELLLKTIPADEIVHNQEAIRELASKIDFRQDLGALGKVYKDSKSLHTALVNWSRMPNKPLSRLINVISYVTPVLLVAFLVAYFTTDNPLYVEFVIYIFLFNTTLLFSQYKSIQHENASADQVDKTIFQYARIIEKIEDQNFQATKLKALQQQLAQENQNASRDMNELGELFSRMDSIANLVSTMLFNGTFLFHIHTLRYLQQWRAKKAKNIPLWLDVIGEMETLSSLANLSYNNPEFAFPVLNNEYVVEFSDLSHPLLNKATRVGNTVVFDPKFMILTGSNMSGKSTFLRSLGINMVLAGIGSPVCATAANVHPLPVLVSMRLSDSLSDSESYFFAEIKRLKLIMDKLEEQVSFVLLDEILRGTNSDDKRSGTIGVVQKMMAKKAIGAIATHDIEVCETTHQYPEQLTNQCFEVQIVDNELFFDYTLRAGICKNKSATFLMNKMGIV